MTDRTISACTAGLALALAMQPWHIATAASHCKALTEAVCGTTAACRWIAAKAPAFGVSARKAHCRLDVTAASKLAAEIAAQRRSSVDTK